MHTRKDLLRGRLISAQTISQTARHQVISVGKRYIIPNIQYDTASSSIPVLSNKIITRNTYLIIGY